MVPFHFIYGLHSDVPFIPFHFHSIHSIPFHSIHFIISSIPSFDPFLGGVSAWKQCVSGLPRLRKNVRGAQMDKPNPFSMTGWLESSPFIPPSTLLPWFLLLSRWYTVYRWFIIGIQTWTPSIRSNRLGYYARLCPVKFTIYHSAGLCSNCSGQRNLYSYFKCTWCSWYVVLGTLLYLLREFEIQRGANERDNTKRRGGNW